MSKYADVLKKGVRQPQSVCSELERVADAVEKHEFYITRPPNKRGNCCYDRWEYSYFPQLVIMYRIFCGDETSWDPPEMYKFFRFLYDVSTGEIWHYPDQITEEQQEAYFEYQVKRYVV